MLFFLKKHVCFVVSVCFWIYPAFLLSGVVAKQSYVNSQYLWPGLVRFFHNFRSKVNYICLNFVLIYLAVRKLGHPHDLSSLITCAVTLLES